jgi:UDP-4-amino-4,6-dideoxy-N-acetyl-beta-L-altrosamine N-acetyltransferase
VDYKLRAIDDADKEMILGWRNSDRIRQNMYTDHIIKPDEHEAWFNVIKEDKSVEYKIFEFKGRPIGLVGFTQINRNHGTCYWAFYLGETDVPSKAGPIMEFLALEYVFECLEIRKLCCEVLSFNDKVVKLHKKFGFHQEGILIKHIMKMNQYEDVFVLAMFKDDWLARKELIAKLLLKN